MKTWFTAAVLLSCTPFVAQAETPQEPLPPAHHRTFSGKTPRAHTPEQIALRMLVRSLLVRHYDADNNGKLDHSEREAMQQEAREALRQQAKAVATRFDHDHDGMLSPEERAEMRKSFHTHNKKYTGAHRHHHATPITQKAGNEHSEAAPPKAHRHHHRMGKMAREMAYISHRLLLQAYDSDTSGQLDEHEMATCRQDALKLYEKRKAELLSRFDTDQDGTLSEAEYKNACAGLLPQPPAEQEAPHQQKGKRRRVHFDPQLAEDWSILRTLSHPACNKSTN